MLTMGNFTYLNIILLLKRARYERYNLYFVALFHLEVQVEQDIHALACSKLYVTL